MTYNIREHFDEGKESTGKWIELIPHLALPPNSYETLFDDISLLIKNSDICGDFGIALKKTTTDTKYYKRKHHPIPSSDVELNGFIMTNLTSVVIQFAQIEDAITFKLKFL